MTHWAAHYIGLPWQYGGSGPDAFDCWGFIRTVQREHFSVDIPAIPAPSTWGEAREAISNNEERQNWTRVLDPREGDLVLMARNRYPVHIGIFILANDTRGVLHCMQHSGVVFNSLPSLKVSGWGALTYYRRATCQQHS